MFKYFVITLLLLSCKSRTSNTESNLLAQASEETVRPAELMFHIGPFEHLGSIQQSIGGFQSDRWKKIGSTQNQAEYRKGFYISQHPGNNERYGESFLGEDQEPWMEVVRLDPKSCKSRSSIYSVEAIKDFSKYLGSVNKRESTYSDCLNESVLGISSWSGSKSRCEQIVGEFYRSKEYEVVYDNWWPGSGFWYITEEGNRNGNCLKSMDSTPLGILKALSEVSDLYSMTPLNNSPQKSSVLSGAVLMSIIGSAVSRLSSDSVDAQSLDDIAKNFDKNNTNQTQIENNVGSMSMIAIIYTQTSKTCIEKGPSYFQEWQNFLKDFHIQNIGILRTDPGLFVKKTALALVDFRTRPTCY